HEPSRRQSTETLVQALQDTDREIRLEAARSLVHLADTDELAQVFRLAVSESPLVRAILAEDLRPHAARLCESVVPNVFRSPHPRQVEAALEMIAVWELALPLPDLIPLIRHFDPDVRRAALKAAPLAPRLSALNTEVIRALADPFEEVAAAAAC